MDGNEFLDMVDQEGWEFILVEFDPTDIIDDEALTEAILDLQDIYRNVVSIASDSGLESDRSDDDDELEELDFDLD